MGRGLALIKMALCCRILASNIKALRTVERCLKTYYSTSAMDSIVGRIKVAVTGLLVLQGWGKNMCNGMSQN